MVEDPRKILVVADVVCTEVDAYVAAEDELEAIRFVYKEEADSAILALAKIVARYKWISEHRLVHELRNLEYQWIIDTREPQEISDLNEYYDKNVGAHG
jgi:hypothetical protein